MSAGLALAWSVVLLFDLGDGYDLFIPCPEALLHSVETYIRQNPDMQAQSNPPSFRFFDTDNLNRSPRSWSLAECDGVCGARRPGWANPGTCWTG